jgi:hypothetical protein
VPARAGKGYIVSPVPVSDVVSVVANDMDPATVGSYPNIPVFVGTATDTPSPSNGLLIFGPGAAGPAGDGDYGFTVWSVG